MGENKNSTSSGLRMKAIMTSLTVTCLVAVIALIFAGCSDWDRRPTDATSPGPSGNSGQAQPGEGGGAQPSEGQKESFDFETAKLQVLNAKCLNCHSAGRGNRGHVNLETYENVFALRGAIASAVGEGSMPPSRSSALTGAEKAYLLRWLEIGAPRTKPSSPPPDPAPSTGAPAPNPQAPPGAPTSPPAAGGGTTSPQEPPTTGEPPSAGPLPTYQEISEKVLIPSCAGCHSSRRPIAGVDLTKYANVLAARDAVLKEVQAGTMPPMNRPPLTSEQSSLLVRWLTAGAPQ